MRAQTDFAAHVRATRTPPQEMAAAMQALLGQRLAAVLLCQRDPKVIGQWARGEHAPRPDAEQRLREAYYIAAFLLEHESDRTVRSWFTGMNPHLDDRTPLMVLAEGRAVDVMQAARAFLADAGA
ncbi:MAG TPA: XRE family transcriptional regulator [Dehalococcoidia bacterium]|jgi:hypothetical protein|nr:XRE family transcriptional regulator [Dehalococcoidia bacterium]